MQKCLTWHHACDPRGAARPARSRSSLSLAHHAPTFHNHLLKVTCFRDVFKLMNSKSLKVNTNLDRVTRPAGVNVFDHHRALLLCCFLRLYKQSFIFTYECNRRSWNFFFILIGWSLRRGVQRLFDAVRVLDGLS